MKKGDQGGFEYDLSQCHGWEFLNELLRHHTNILELKFVYKIGGPLSSFPPFG